MELKKAHFSLRTLRFRRYWRPRPDLHRCMSVLSRGAGSCFAGQTLIWRPGWELHPRIAVLQTAALLLGYLVIAGYRAFHWVLFYGFTGDSASTIIAKLTYLSSFRGYGIVGLMKKIGLILILILVPFLFSGCSLKKQPAALQINSTPVAAVFINGKNVGKTPYLDRNVTAGEITLKLIPESTAQSLSSWEGKIKLVGGVLSVINREFAETQEASSGEILTLEPIRDKKSASLAVVTTPDGAVVMVDGQNRGFTPLVLDKISAGERQISLTLTGYGERVIKAKAFNGYKLVVNSKLAQETEPIPTPTLEAGLSPTPTKKVTVTPTPKPKTTPAAGQVTVVVKGTPAGWLRVREEASSSSKELARVDEGDEFTLLEEKNGWYKIAYEQGKEGWISGQYVEK